MFFELNTRERKIRGMNSVGAACGNWKAEPLRRQEQGSQELAPSIHPRGFLLRPGGEDGLKMRIGFFAIHHSHLDITEAGVLQETMELHFTEAEPVIEVK